LFPNSEKPDGRVREIRTWLKEQGVLSLEPVTLFAEQLEKVCFGQRTVIQAFST
jgi:5'-3' exoribonuclease 1